MAKKKEERKALLRNRKARFNYVVEETLETGVVLSGSEVKSLREGNGSLVDAHGLLKAGELWLIGAKIDPYPFANLQNHVPLRERKLLAHRREIRRLAAKVREKGFALVPLEIYLKDGKIKVELALARGKRHYEKREAKRAEEARREMEE